MGNIRNQTSQFQSAFTRLELAVVLACLFLIGLVTLPLLGRSRSTGNEMVCMNNLRNLGRCFLMYSERNNGYVPDEGNTGLTVIHSANTYAWYNAAVLPEYPSMRSLYIPNNVDYFPMPANGSVYSCPSAPSPSITPSVAWAFFMYGENNWLCVNASTRAVTQTAQTSFSTIPKPSATIMIGELNDNDLGLPAYSGVTAQYAVARHDGFGLFAMCDGSVRAFRTNEFNHLTTSAPKEWYVNGTDPSAGLNSWPCYWWPSPTTPN